MSPGKVWAIAKEAGVAPGVVGRWASGLWVRPSALQAIKAALVRLGIAT